MKRILSLVLALALISTIIFVPEISYAVTNGVYGNNLTWTLDEKGTLIISGKGDMIDYSVSWHYEHSPFYENKNIKKIIIENGITSIGNAAFADCENLISVDLPYGITRIGEDSFNSCYNLLDLKLPDSVTDIGDMAFWFCEKLDSIEIPNGVVNIGDYAFGGCRALKKIKIPDSVVNIEYSSFGGYCCENLTDIEVSPNNKYYSSLNGNLFNKDKTELIKYASGKLGSSYTIPGGVTSIRNKAFEYSCNLIEIMIPDSVTYIGDEAFVDCDGLTDIIIPVGITSIGKGMFGGCHSLTEIIIPTGVKTIRDGAFDLCDNLTNISIPESVTSISQEAFKSCDSLSDVYYGGSEEQWNRIIIDRWFNDCLLKAKIHFNSKMPVRFKYTQSSVTDNTYKGSSYDEFLGRAQIGAVIPGLKEYVVPQGIAYREDTNQYYISGDPDDKKKTGAKTETTPSVIMVLDADTGEYVGEYYLHNSDGSAFTGHTGGIAIGAGNLYVTNGSGLSIVPLSQIDGTAPKGDIHFTQTVKLALGDANLSYCSYSNGILWTGNFYYKGGKAYNKPAYTDTEVGMTHFALLQGYVLDPGTGTGFKNSSRVSGEKFDYAPDYLCELPSKIQGAAAVGGRLVLSQSYGRDNKSNLLIYDDPTTAKVNYYVNLGGKSVALRLPQKAETVTAIPMMEGIVSHDNQITAVFESGAMTYSDAKDRTDRIWNIDVADRNIDERKNYPIIVLPGIMGSTLKTGSNPGLGVPVLTENLDFIPQEDMEIADSLAADTGANDFMAALRANGNAVYACPYDWRLSIDKAAELYLKPLIDQVKSINHADKVILVAHSMGGLVSRSYIQSGYYENDVSSLYMLGTPNMGSTAIIPLAEFGAPFDGAQATVLAYNYGKMTGEDYNQASLAEVKNFVNSKVIGATQLLPTYASHYWDIEADRPFANVSNSFLTELNRQAMRGEYYQKIDGTDPDKVRTMLIASNAEDTPNAIKVNRKDGFISMPYKRALIKTTLGHEAQAVMGIKLVDTVDSVGDGTVLTRSATGSVDGLNDLWTVDSGSYGKHMKMMKSLKGKMGRLLSDANAVTAADAAIMDNLDIFSAAEDTEPLPAGSIRIEVTGTVAADLVGVNDEIDITSGYSADAFPDGTYTITAEKDTDENRATVQLTYVEEENLRMETFSFINDVNSITFTIENGMLNIDNRTVKQLRSANNGGKAELIWDKNENALSYNVYSKPYSGESYTLLGNTTETSYQTNDVWLGDFSEDCVNYYVIPVYEDGEGGYDTGVHNYNNAEASFTYSQKADNTVEFTDASLGEITSWEWDFDGDGLTDSTEQNPIYKYENDGIYSVTLKVSGPSGTSETTYDDIIKIGDYITSLEVPGSVHSIKTGEGFQLDVYGTTNKGNRINITDKAVYVSDSDVLSVSETGYVTANREGETAITIIVDDLQLIYPVTVTDKDLIIENAVFENEKADITISNFGSESVEGVVLLAEYDSNGALLNIFTKNTEIGSGENIVTLENITVNDPQNTKVFLWNNTDEIKPLIEALEG